MGIPVFFKTLITDYTHVIKPLSPNSVDALFFDLNCLIHPCCAKVTDGDESAMIVLIIEHIHKLIQLTGATFVYLAIDGPAPKAKMIQQRTRRHKSVLEAKPWDTNAITPGTKFMNRLNDELHKEFKGTGVLISDSSEPGEGEHKILQYLKTNKSQFARKRTCIYGLDADLIMLALVSGLKDIYLLRERTSFNLEQMDCEYLYLDITALKKEILAEFPTTSKPSQHLIQDYCFICFLLGNDFVQHSPSLILRYDGLHHLLYAYKQCLQKNPKFYLLNPKTKGILHKDNFLQFLRCLASSETERLQDIHTIRLKQHRKYRRIYDDIQKHKHTVKAPSYSGFPVEDIMRHKPILFMNDERTIFESRDTWADRYNTFTITGSHTPLPVQELSQKVQKVCHEYMKSLVWTSHYYFNECLSQEWYYPYEFAPTLQDLVRYYTRVTIKPHPTITPIKQQLEFIFPSQSYPLSDELTPSDEPPFSGFTKVFTLLKRYDWECEPIF